MSIFYNSKAKQRNVLTCMFLGNKSPIFYVYQHITNRIMYNMYNALAYKMLYRIFYNPHHVPDKSLKIERSGEAYTSTKST